MQWQLVSRRRQPFNRVHKGPGENFRGRQRRPKINSQNEPQGSVGSPAAEWSMPPPNNVRCWEQSGKHLLAVRISHIDPKRTLRAALFDHLVGDREHSRSLRR